MNLEGPKSGCATNATSALLDDVAPYRDFLRGLKRDQRRIAVTGILGPEEPFAVELRAPPGGGAPVPSLVHSCSYMGATGMVEVADPATRLMDLLDAFWNKAPDDPPVNPAFTKICQQDLSVGLVQTGELFRKAIGSPCVDALLADAKPKTTGLQVDCVVEDLVGASAIEIKSCEADLTARPCWRLESDPATCTGFQNLRLVVQRDVAPDPTATTRMRCLVEP
jgi:hypothetical protein